MNGSRFTQICAELARLRDPFRADLHLHTFFSDGTHSPAELIRRAKDAKLGAIAVTDHDTTSGLEPTRNLSGNLEVIPGVEITSEWNGKEVHLLGYFFDPNHNGLQNALRWIREGRRERAIQIGRRFPKELPSVERMIDEIPEGVAIGRRHVARWLVAARAAGSMHDVFSRLFSLSEIKEIPRRRLPLGEAIELVKAAGGICSHAHPPEDTTLNSLRELRDLGLDAVEARYPWQSKSRSDRLIEWADSLGLLVTGGSDSHDSTPPARNVGVRGIGRSELDKLRALASQRAAVSNTASPTPVT